MTVLVANAIKKIVVKGKQFFEFVKPLHRIFHQKAVVTNKRRNLGVGNAERPVDELLAIFFQRLLGCFFNIKFRVKIIRRFYGRKLHEGCSFLQ